jgi:hypothetical protein
MKNRIIAIDGPKGSALGTVVDGTSFSQMSESYRSPQFPTLSEPANTN